MFSIIIGISVNLPPLTFGCNGLINLSECFLTSLRSYISSYNKPRRTYKSSAPLDYDVCIAGVSACEVNFPNLLRSVTYFGFCWIDLFLPNQEQYCRLSNCDADILLHTECIIGVGLGNCTCWICQVNHITMCILRIVGISGLFAIGKANQLIQTVIGVGLSLVKLSILLNKNYF